MVARLQLHVAAFILWASLQYGWLSAFSADTRLAKGHIRGQERVAVFDNLLSPLSSVTVLPVNTSRISNTVDVNNPYVTTVFSNRAKEVLPRLSDAPRLGNVVADFDLKVSMRAARLESISYCVNNDEIMRWNCTRCTGVAGVTPYAIIYDDTWDVMAIVAYDAELEAITVMFRGTDSSNLWNWFEDLRYWKTNYMMDLPDAVGAKIHTGFWLLWSSSILEQNVTDAFSDVRSKYPEATVYIIGHSMGGALAQLCALHFRSQLDERSIHLYTYGSPRVGNDVFAALLQSYVTENWRFTHNRDLVPSVPFQILGFHHAAQEVWLVDVEDADTKEVDEKIIICDGTGEDPTCHNSVCHLGLCTSIADHLMYLGIHLYRDELEC